MKSAVCCAKEDSRSFTKTCRYFGGIDWFAGLTIASGAAALVHARFEENTRGETLSISLVLKS
jgi:hypothetical protein